MENSVYFSRNRCPPRKASLGGAADIISPRLPIELPRPVRDREREDGELESVRQEVSQSVRERCKQADSQ